MKRGHFMASWSPPIDFLRWISTNFTRQYLFTQNDLKYHFLVHHCIFSMAIMICSFLPLSCFIFLGFFFSIFSQAKDTLWVNETMDIYGTLESSNGLFRLDFLRRPGSSPYSRFLGIQFRDMNDPVWVALPSVNISDFPVLRMESNGRLVIIDQVSGDVFTVNVEQTAMSKNTTAVLLDNGNLVLRAGSSTLWQSFDYPGNTWFPGMKLGLFHLNTSQPQQHQLTSWIIQGQPSFGSFTLGLDPNNTKQLLVMRRGVPYWRSGIWNGKNFTFIRFSNNFSVTFSHFCDEKDCYFSWNDSKPYNFIQLSDMGQINIFSGDQGGSRDSIAVCEIDDQAEGKGLSEGCVTPTPSNCGISHRFTNSSGVIDDWNIFFNSSFGPSDCKEICRRNCSCFAYTSAFSNGTGCKFSERGRFTYLENGENFYFRPNPSLDKDSTGRRSSRRKMKLIVSVTVITPLLVLSLVFLICLKFRNSEKLDAGERADDDQLPCYSLLTIKTATENFSDRKKLGEGGFGAVYKGLLNGQEIAVKRLSTISNHGIEQFKNEVKLISNLQHRNLVKLLGYCTHGEERLLVYEYLPNKSLDSLLFDESKRALLDWKKRVNIIHGIAQGLLYLHKYSRLKIIHRDLKISNILLDSDMNPKISDFGIARIFQEDDSPGNTKRIMGTYGYMSPEYVINGLFSEKSDIFSFGVMVLEIISGKKNTSLYHSNRHINLLGYAWDLWKEGRLTELADPKLSGTFCITSGVRHVQVALLCVQEIAANRPAMPDVVSMLTNESIALPDPKKPAFYTVDAMSSDSIPESPQPCSASKLTISVLEGR